MSRDSQISDQDRSNPKIMFQNAMRDERRSLTASSMWSAFDGTVAGGISAMIGTYPAVYDYVPKTFFDNVGLFNPIMENMPSAAVPSVAGMLGMAAVRSLGEYFNASARGGVYKDLQRHPERIVDGDAQIDNNWRAHVRFSSMAKLGILGMGLGLATMTSPLTLLSTSIAAGGYLFSRHHLGMAQGISVAQRHAQQTGYTVAADDDRPKGPGGGGRDKKWWDLELPPVWQPAPVPVPNNRPPVRRKASQLACG